MMRHTMPQLALWLALLCTASLSQTQTASPGFDGYWLASALCGGGAVTESGILTSPDMPDNTKAQLLVVADVGLSESLTFDAGAFPSCQGSAVEALSALSRLVSEKGWGGVGIALPPGVPSGDGWYTVRFAKQQGRFVRLVAKSEVAGGSWASCAELAILGPDGAPIARETYSAAGCNSFNTASGEGPEKCFDGDPVTMWHTDYTAATPTHPHDVTIDLGASEDVTGLRYLPREVGLNGVISKAEVLVSEDGTAWGPAAWRGEIVPAGTLLPRATAGWTDILRTCASANIRLLLIRSDSPIASDASLRQLAALRDVDAPDLALGVRYVGPALNDPLNTGLMAAAEGATLGALLSACDVLDLGSANPDLSLPTLLERAAWALRGSTGGGTLAVNASSGLATPLGALWVGDTRDARPQLFRREPDQADEDAAPATPRALTSPGYRYSTHRFEAEGAPDPAIADLPVHQGAPAVTALGCGLPALAPSDAPVFVIARKAGASRLDVTILPARELADDALASAEVVLDLGEARLIRLTGGPIGLRLRAQGVTGIALALPDGQTRAITELCMLTAEDVLVPSTALTQGQAYQDVSLELANN